MRWAIVVFVLALAAVPSVVAIDDIEWPGFGHDSRHTSTASVDTSIPDPVELWDRNDPVSGLAVAQGNFTGNIEFINGSDASSTQPFHAVYAVGGFLYIVDGRSGDTMWLLDVDEIDGNNSDSDQVAVGPLIADLYDPADDDGLGVLDVVFGTNDGEGRGALYAYTPYIMFDGDDYSWSSNNAGDDRLWRKNLNLPLLNSNPMLTSVQDVGEVISVGAGDTLFVLKSWNRDVVWSEELEGEDVSSPAALPTGSSNDIVVSSVNWTSEEVYFHRFNAKSGFRKFFETKDIDDYTGSGHILPSVTVLDLDQNSSNGREVLYPVPLVDSDNNGVIYAYDGTGEPLWATSVSGDIDGQLEATPAGHDLDGDGVLEVVVVAWDRRDLTDYDVDVTVWNGEDGDMVWRKTLNYYNGTSPDEGRAVSSPVLVDVDGDETLDVICTQSDHLFVLSGEDGSLVHHEELPYRLWAQPAVFNMGGDLYCEILAGSKLFTHDIADLRPVNIELDPESTEEGGKVNITAVIENSGGKDATSARVHLLIDGEDIEHKEVSPGGGGDRRLTVFEWRPRTNGTYEITIAVDPEENIDESDEDNNNMTTSIEVSQVLYINVTPLNASVDPHASVNLTVDIENSGSGEVSVNLTATTPDDWGAEFTDERVDVPAGGNATVNLTITPDAGYVSGQYNITVGATTSLLDKNETVPVFLEPTYDMRFGENVSGGIPSDQTGNFTLTLFNDGNAPDNATIVVDAPGDWEGEAQQPSVTVGPFSSADVVIDVTAPDIDEGSEVIGVEAQYTSGTAEASLDIEIQVPDFEAKEIWLYREDGEKVGPDTSKHPIAGRETRISLQARSTGEIGGWAPVALFIDDEIVESRDAFFDLGDSVPVNFTVVFDSDANVTVAIDPNDEVYEVHESDNNASTSITTIPSNTDAEFHLLGTVYQPGGIDPVPEAFVNITVVRTDTEIKFQADDDGEFDIDLGEVLSSYREGEVLNIYSSDGINRTMEQVEVVVYSEDGPWIGGIELNFSQYYFYMEMVGSNLQYTDGGEEVAFDFIIVNEDDRTNNVSFQIIGFATWPDAFVTLDGDEVDEVSIDPTGSLDLVMHIPVPVEAESEDEPYTIQLNGRSDTGESRPPIELIFNIVVVHRSDLGFSSVPDAQHFLANGTVVASVFSCSNDGNGDEEFTATIETDLGGNWSYDLVLQDSYEAQTFSRDDDIQWKLLHEDEVEWTFSPIVPNGTSAGDHWFNITITALNGSYNVSVRTRVLAAELSVVTLYTDDMLQVDTTIELTVIVKNSGNLGVDTNVVFGSESLGDGGTDTSSDDETAFIAADTDHEWTVPWVPRQTGLHRLTVTVDPENDIGELNEDNNEYAVTLRVVEEEPDLNVTYVDVQSDPIVGREVEVRVTIENSGVVDADEVDVSLIDTSGSKTLDTQSVVLDAGESETVSLYWTPTRSGSYDLVAVVDPDGEIEETSEKNNEMRIHLEVGDADDDESGNLISLAILAAAVIVLALLFGRRHITLPRIRAKPPDKDGEEGDAPEPEEEEKKGDDIEEIDGSTIVIVGEEE